MAEAKKDTGKIEEGEEGEEDLKCDHACDGGEGGKAQKGQFLEALILLRGVMVGCIKFNFGAIENALLF